MIKSIVRKIVITIKFFIRSIYSFVSISKSIKISNAKNIPDIGNLLPKNFKKIQVGIIGTGDISITHINNLKGLSNIFQINIVCSRTIEKAKMVAKQNNIPNETDNYMDIIRNSKIDAIFILTRHNSHVEIAMEGIKANKAIFMEKPLAINLTELNKLEDALKIYEKPFMVGFNRRHSPHIQYIKNKIDQRESPILVNYRQNDKNYPIDNWIRGPEGGGVIIGHFCHIIDLFNYLIDKDICSIIGSKINNKMKRYIDNDNFGMILTYKDGSIVNIIHTTFGNNKYPKDIFEIFFDDNILEMNNYEITNHYTENYVKKGDKNKDKGYLNEVVEFAKMIVQNNNNLEDTKKIINATKLLFRIQKEFNKKSDFYIKVESLEK